MSRIHQRHGFFFLQHWGVELTHSHSHIHVLYQLAYSLGEKDMEFTSKFDGHMLHVLKYLGTIKKKFVERCRVSMFRCTHCIVGISLFCDRSLF